MKRIIILLLFLIINILISAVPAYAASVCVSDTDFSCLNTIFVHIIQIAFSGAAIATFVMILMGGFSWLSSGGDPKAMEKARDQLTYGVTGLFLMVAALFILKFIKDFTGANVTDFKVGL